MRAAVYERRMSLMLFFRCDAAMPQLDADAPRCCTSPYATSRDAFAAAAVVMSRVCRVLRHAAGGLPQ